MCLNLFELRLYLQKAIYFFAIIIVRRLDYQPLFRKGARAPPPTRLEKVAEIEPTSVVGISRQVRLLLLCH